MRRFINGIVSVVVLISSLLIPGNGAEAKTTEQSFSKDKKPLVLEHAKEIFKEKKNSFDVAWHYSHSSHVSHSSHASHASHYSHYSGY